MNIDAKGGEEMDRGIKREAMRRGGSIGKNFLAASGCFIIFSVFVAVADIALPTPAHAYFFGGVAFFVLSLVTKFIASNFLRGFPIYVSFLIVPSLAFPIDDWDYLPAEDIMILVALAVMVIAMCIIWVRIIRFD